MYNKIKKSDSCSENFCELNVCDVLNDGLEVSGKNSMINCEENTWKGKCHHLHLALMLMSFKTKVDFRLFRIRSLR